MNRELSEKELQAIADKVVEKIGDHLKTELPSMLFEQAGRGAWAFIRSGLVMILVGLAAYGYAKYGG